MNWSLGHDKLAVISPSKTTIHLPEKAIEVIDYSEVGIVLLSRVGTDNQTSDNAIAYNVDGSIRWRTDGFHPAPFWGGMKDGKTNLPGRGLKSLTLE